MGSSGPHRHFLSIFHFRVAKFVILVFSPTTITSMQLTANNVNQIFMTCLFAENEDTTNHVVGSGVVNNVEFHPKRLEDARGDVIEMVKCLPAVFINNGMSFLGMNETADGVHWGEHRTMNELLCLADALGILEYPIPREMWGFLPGGVPYVNFKV